MDSSLGIIYLYFIRLTNWKQAPTKEMIERTIKKIDDIENQGIKFRVYWTLGRYDAIAIIRASTEKDSMKMLLGFQGIVNTETMVAVPREEAIKLL
ncbi:MAG: GYD domain-containing protein [Candidatus Hodarchaeales archaeon]